jgi:hypothetical protein
MIPELITNWPMEDCYPIQPITALSDAYQMTTRFA